MITTLKIILDYRCYPVWLYDENGFIIDTLLPDELKKNIKLDRKFDDLQARYDALFIDNGKEFSYVGFESALQKTQFLKDWASAVSELKAKTNGKYVVIDEIDKAF